MLRWVPLDDEAESPPGDDDIISDVVVDEEGVVGWLRATTKPVLVARRRYAAFRHVVVGPEAGERGEFTVDNMCFEQQKRRYVASRRSV